MSLRFYASIYVCFISLLMLNTPAFAQNKQIVAGAGPSTKICKLFFAEFNQLDGINDYSFSVMDGSVKHKGGILNSDRYLFGRTGRPLTKAEKALNKEELFLAKIPIAFAKGLEVNVSQLSMEDISKIFTGKIKNWQEVGGPNAPILLVGREPGEALFITLKEQYPFFKNVAFKAVFKKDHEVVNFLTSPLGRHAIAFGAKPNFSEFNLLKVTNFSSGVNVGLVYDLKNEDNPIIQKAIKFAGSKEWSELVKETDMLSVR